MAGIDVDEFIVIFDKKNINSLLEKYEPYGALGIPWSMFGSSGHLTRPIDGVKNSYLWRRPDEGMWVKPIINTQYCTGIGDPHYGSYSKPSVNESCEIFLGPITDSPRKIFKLNHYFTRSYEEWLKKVARGTGNINTPPRPLSWFKEINDACTIYDDTLKDYDTKRDTVKE
jgi:hypothetical protein